MAERTDDSADLKSRCDALQNELSSVKGERDAARADATRERTRADAATAAFDGEKARSSKLIDPSKLHELVATRVSLESRARTVVGASFDSKDKNGKPKTDAAIMLEAIVATDPNFRADGSDAEDAAYLRGRFDAACGHAAKTDSAAAKLNEGSRPELDTKADGKPATKVNEAIKRADEDARKAYTAAPPACARTRK